MVYRLRDIAHRCTLLFPKPNAVNKYTSIPVSFCEKRALISIQISFLLKRYRCYVIRKLVADGVSFCGVNVLLMHSFHYLDVFVKVLWIKRYGRFAWGSFGIVIAQSAFCSGWWLVYPMLDHGERGRNGILMRTTFVCNNQTAIWFFGTHCVLCTLPSQCVSSNSIQSDFWQHYMNTHICLFYICEAF